MTNKNKKQLKESGPSQSIPTPKSILNYKDDDVVEAIQKEVGKEKDFTVLRITHQSNQYYNVVISWIIPDEDWSFELDKYKYIQLLHQYRVDLFTELSKLIPVVNVNLAAFDFIKGGEEIKFALTILLSDTNNKDWVTGRKKQTIDQRERLKLLQTETVKKDLLKGKLFESKQLNESYDIVEHLMHDVYKFYHEFEKNGYPDEDIKKLYFALYNRELSDDVIQKHRDVLLDEIDESIHNDDIDEYEARDIRNRLKEKLLEGKKLNEIHYEPSKIKERQFEYPFSKFKTDLFELLYDTIGDEYSMEDVENLMGLRINLIKNNWYDGKSIQDTVNEIKKKFAKKPKEITYDNSIDESKKLNEVEFDPFTLKQRENDYPFEDYKIAVFDELERNTDNKISSEKIESIMFDYNHKIKQAWYEEENPESIAIHLLASYGFHYESKKVGLKEGVYNYNQQDYTYYICELVNGDIKINEGFETKEDALYRLKEQREEGHVEGLNFKVISGKFLKQKGVDPNEDSNWGNPSYMEEMNEDGGDKKFHKVMDEWGKGTLKSGSWHPVTSQKQALAVAYSESGKDKQNESFEEQEGTWINEDYENLQDIVSFIGNRQSAADIYNTLKQKNVFPKIKKGNKRWKIDVLKKVLNRVGLSAKSLDQSFKQIPGYEGFSYFGGDPGGLYEDVELDYEFQPANVPGMPTTDEDFLECNSNMKSIPVKESDLVEGKLYSLFESNGLIVETVQYIKKQEGKYLFEKSATGRRLKLTEKEISLYLKKVMKKKKINEGWKKREQFNSKDAFVDVEKARNLPGVIQANAITKNELVIIYNSRKIDSETIKKKLLSKHSIDPTIDNDIRTGPLRRGFVAY